MLLVACGEQRRGKERRGEEKKREKRRRYVVDISRQIIEREWYQQFLEKMCAYYYHIAIVIIKRECYQWQYFVACQEFRKGEGGYYGLFLIIGYYQLLRFSTYDGLLQVVTGSYYLLWVITIPLVFAPFPCVNFSRGVSLPDRITVTHSVLKLS